MKMNWKVRIKNKQFWVSLIPALALLIQAVAALFGWTLDLTEFTGKLLAVVDAVFAVLVILGIVVDPTTKGVRDSERAMGYIEPWEDTYNFDIDEEEWAETEAFLNGLEPEKEADAETAGTEETKEPEEAKEPETEEGNG